LRPEGRQAERPQIVEEILKAPAGTKVVLLAPLVQNRKGEHRESPGGRAEARVRARARGRQVKGLEEKIELDKKSKHDLELVIDRLVLSRTCGRG